MMLWSLQSRARRGPYVTEGRKQLPSAISALSLRPELQTAPAAGVIPGGAVWHHDPVVTVAKLSSRHRASGAGHPSQSDDGDGDEEREAHLKASNYTFSRRTIWFVNSLNTQRGGRLYHSDVRDHLRSGAALLLSGKRSRYPEVSALRTPLALSLRGK
ncbi:hypothetical protein OH76DRAFT_512201 [Lentinus brumalis]|uniref:Uncharacterized protein n=1 Tax=Lentinus brumalis TaxID=2498619 RepID=A0A371DB77_9APHY|nr:hypothetical protein OH76DRAFT_512201 [Polyporus brumalis]